MSATVPLLFGLTIEFGPQAGWQMGIAVAVETDGTIQMSGETGLKYAVRIVVGDRHLSVESDGDFSGEWDTVDLRIKPLNDGFAIRANGEEFVLRVDDEVGVAEELGVAAATPRLARKMAARHNPEERPLSPEPEPVKSNFGALAFALAGVFVIVGGTFLQSTPGSTIDPTGDVDRFWIVFVGGGLLMVAAAYVMTLRRRWGRVGAWVTLGGVIVSFGLLVSRVAAETSALLGYVFIAAGLVVGVAVMFSESLQTTES